MNTKLNILLVEDEEQARKKTSNYITVKHQHNVIEAIDGEDAWEKYLINKPQVIFTDLNIPKINGLDLIKKIRVINKDVKIIVISGYDDKEKLHEAIKLNLQEYLVKPLSYDIFDEILEKLKEDINKINNKIYLTPKVYYESKTKCIYENNSEVKFTKKESMLIDLLVKKFSQPVSSYEIHNYIYELETDFNINAIRTLIKKVRKKLPKNVLENIYGGSYKLHYDNN
jgi:two-component system, OmpR family, response regulator VanR